LDKLSLNFYCLNKFCLLKSLGQKLKEARNSKNLILRKAAALLDIDQSLISKFEKNERRPTEEQIARLAIFYNIPVKELMVDWLSEKFVVELSNYDLTSEVLKFTDKKIKYYRSQTNEK